MTDAVPRPRPRDGDVREIHDVQGASCTRGVPWRFRRMLARADTQDARLVCHEQVGAVLETVPDLEIEIDDVL